MHRQPLSHQLFQTAHNRVATASATTGPGQRPAERPPPTGCDLPAARKTSCAQLIHRAAYAALGGAHFETETTIAWQAPRFERAMGEQDGAKHLSAQRERRRAGTSVNLALMPRAG